MPFAVEVLRAALQDQERAMRRAFDGLPDGLPVEPLRLLYARLNAVWLRHADAIAAAANGIGYSRFPVPRIELTAEAGRIKMHAEHWQNRHLTLRVRDANSVEYLRLDEQAHSVYGELAVTFQTDWDVLFTWLALGSGDTPQPDQFVEPVLQIGV